jgi:hypothetical protein
MADEIFIDGDDTYLATASVDAIRIRALAGRESCQILPMGDRISTIIDIIPPEYRKGIAMQDLSRESIISICAAIGTPSIGLFDNRGWMNKLEYPADANTIAFILASSHYSTLKDDACAIERVLSISHFLTGRQIDPVLRFNIDDYNYSNRHYHKMMAFANLYQRQPHSIFTALYKDIKRILPVIVRISIIPEAVSDLECASRYGKLCKKCLTSTSFDHII